MVCGLEIPLAILGAVAGIMTAVASLSESLALQKNIVPMVFFTEYTTSFIQKNA